MFLLFSDTNSRRTRLTFIAAREVAERTRRKQSQFVFGGTWDKPLE